MDEKTLELNISAEILNDRRNKLIGIKIVEYLKSIKEIKRDLSRKQKKELFNVLRIGFFLYSNKSL